MIEMAYVPCGEKALDLIVKGLLLSTFIYALTCIYALISVVMHFLFLS